MFADYCCVIFCTGAINLIVISNPCYGLSGLKDNLWHDLFWSLCHSYVLHKQNGYTLAGLCSSDRIPILAHASVVELKKAKKSKICFRS